MSSKICKSSEVLNPLTNRCIKKNGQLHKKLIKEGVIHSADEKNKQAQIKVTEQKKYKGPVAKICAEDQILNPETNRCIKKGGAIHNKLLRERAAMKKMSDASKKSVTPNSKATNAKKAITLIKELFEANDDDMFEKIEKFALTWKEYLSIIRNNKTFECLEPQMYEVSTMLNRQYSDVFDNKLGDFKNASDEDIREESMFYESGGLAVTGSGAEPWIKVSPQLIKYLQERIKKVKK